MKKIVFVSSGHEYGLVRLALRYLSDAINKEGIECILADLERSENIEHLEDADVVMIYRTFDQRSLNLIRRLREKCFVMFFLDDYLFQPNCKYTYNWQAPIEHLEASDCLVSSSAVLLSKMPDKPKILRRTVLDEEAMGILNQEYRRDESIFNIGWIGSSGRRAMMDHFVYKILKILDQKLGNSDIKCYFYCFGNREYPQFDNVQVKEHFYIDPKLWKELYEKWVSFDLSVIINPLDETDDFCHCKSELKLIESGAMGVPLITSRVPPFTDITQEGINGFFASTPEEYVEKILLLKKDVELSRKVSKNVKEYVVKNYDVRDNAIKFLKDVKKAMRIKTYKQVIVKPF